MIQPCYCPCDLFKKSLSILKSLRLFLKLGISLLGRFICLGIARYSTSELLIRSLSVPLYLLGIDKISDFSYSSPNCLFEDTFLKNCHNIIIMLRRYFSLCLFKSSIYP